MAKKLTNVETYLIILFLFAILVSGLTWLGNEAAVNPNADLDNDSIEYIATLNGIDLSDYQQSESELESSILATGNYSQGNPKDESIDFLFAKEKGSKVELAIKRFFSLPSFIIGDLFRLPINNFKWLIDLFGWLVGLLIIIALVYFARGQINR